MISCDAYKNGRCLGTKEVDPCNCGGDKAKCSFYENVREQGRELEKTYESNRSDRQACKNGCNPDCEHTSDIRHAKNFKDLINDGTYWEVEHE